jgi:hypothetical protein
MTNNNKRRNSNNKNGKGSSPRNGAKAKQNKVTPAKETDSKAVRQTILSFAPTGTQNPSNPTTQNKDDPAILTTAITPEGPRTRLAHPSPCTTPDRPTKTTVINTAPSKQKTNIKTQKNTVPNDNTPNDDTASADTQSTDHTKPTPSTPPSPSNGDTTPKKTTFQESKDNDTSEIEPSAERSFKVAATTQGIASHTDDPSKKKAVPLSLQSPAKTYESIRYNGQIVTIPSEQPFPDFLVMLNDFFRIIQDVLGKDVYIAAWDSEQEKAFPPIKQPSKLPTSRESLGIYLGTYINPKKDGSRIYLNLRLITFKTNPVPLARFGIELAASRSLRQLQT